MTVGNKKKEAPMTICKSMKSSQMDSQTLESTSIRKVFIWELPHQLVISHVMALPAHLAMKLLMLKILLLGASTLSNTTAVVVMVAKLILIGTLSCPELFKTQANQLYSLWINTVTKMLVFGEEILPTLGRSLQIITKLLHNYLNQHLGNILEKA